MKNKVFVYLMKQESCAIKSPGELDVSIIFLQIFKFKFVSSSDKVGRFVTNHSFFKISEFEFSNFLRSEVSQNRPTIL